VQTDLLLEVHRVVSQNIGGSGALLIGLFYLMFNGFRHLSKM
jgi:hypothetical protein